MVFLQYYNCSLCLEPVGFSPYIHRHFSKLHFNVFLAQSLQVARVSFQKITVNSSASVHSALLWNTCNVSGSFLLLLQFMHLKL